ncbi:hypothetical protein [Dactylosporangium sp. NPDC050588]|uniref:hypothetical protein n=1 Tax=Dactylosporangium sp. NPDC050588 TaxID=3157211 RepID=UPI0033CBE4AD
MIEPQVDALSTPSDDDVVTAGRIPPYTYDPERLPALATLVDAACDGAADPHGVALRVDELSSQIDPLTSRSEKMALFHTFMYLLEVTTPDQARVDARLEPLDGPSLLPVALRDATEAMRTLWLGLAEHVRHPMARARCWDIVFTLTLVRNRRTSAEQAINAYLEASKPPTSRRHRGDGLVRAWVLARRVSLNDTATSNAIREAMKTLATEGVDQGDPYPAMTVLAALISPGRTRSESVDPAVDTLLDRALLAYSQVHIISGFATLIRCRAGEGSERAEQASRHEVNAMIAEADAATDAMIIRNRYSEAAAAAHTYGLADLEKSAVAGLQSAPRVSWTVSEYKITTPSRFFHAHLPGFSQASEWRQALTIWLHSTAPSGSFTANERAANRNLQASVMTRLASMVIFRDGDLPARALDGDADRLEHALVQIEQQTMEMRGRFLARALVQLQQQFGIPSQADLKAFLLQSEAAPNFAQALATAFQLYWVEEYDACCHLIVPKIEAATRALLLELNEPMYRAAVGDSVGQFPGLGSLLPLLVENDFDPDWERFLRTLLLNYGTNLRNLIAHGYADGVGPVDAALALRAAAVLVLVTNGNAAGRDAAQVRATLRTPTGNRRQDRWWRRCVAALSIVTRGR